MNEIIQSLFTRKSIRQYKLRPIASDEKELILQAALQAPTAGNQNLYTILDITDKTLKEELSRYFDNQPFIAQAPLALVFLADCRRWLDSYRVAGLEARPPGEGDFLLAVADALIAAQNTVVAAESLGIGSCYIGDILEQEEKVREALALDEYVFPAAFVVYGYPGQGQMKRAKPPRPPVSLSAPRVSRSPQSRSRSTATDAVSRSIRRSARWRSSTSAPPTSPASAPSRSG